MKNKYTLFILIAVLSFTDAICTLLNANPGYWANYNDYGVEYNPLGAWALHNGPFVYVLFVMVWVFVIFLLLKYLPRKIGALVGVIFWFGHSIAGLGTQGTYVVYSRLHIGNENDATSLTIAMMLLTAVNAILFTYALIKFLGYDLVLNKALAKTKSKKRH